jgi:succinoglycan biosynthesis transport protein ExoP
VQLLNRDFFSAIDKAPASADSDAINFDVLLSAVRRQWFIVFVAAAVGVIAGIAFLQQTVPLYEASATVIMDRDSKRVIDELSLGAGALDDEGSVLSQIELIRSEAVALSVVDKIGLISDPQFNAQPRSLPSIVMRPIVNVLKSRGWWAQNTQTVKGWDERRQRAADALRKSITVNRVGRSYVLEISYESASGTLSAKIVNATAEAYLDDKLNSKYEATRRASSWLVDRIAELRQKSLDTDLAVQKFRTAHGLISTGDRLVSDQQLSELNSALIVAQSDVVSAQAKLQRINQILQSGQNDAIVTEVLASSVSNELRTKYLMASKLEAQISARQGPNHAQAVRARGEMEDYKKLMFDELTRIAESYRSEADVALAREKSLKQSVVDATGVTTTANETQVQMRELEREAETYKNLYQTFLQRYQEAIQQQSFPMTDARIITRGSPATHQSYPDHTMIVAFFAFAGASIGAAVGGIREFRDRFFRIGDQVRNTLGVEFLGNLPHIASVRARMPLKASRNAQQIWKHNSIFEYATQHPLSAFSETLRNCRLAADMGGPAERCTFIGIVSALPGEGKTAVAINFAELLASEGRRTVLVDADLRNPGATRALGAHAQFGLIEALTEKYDVETLLMRNPVTNLQFLPAVLTHRVANSSEVLNSRPMRHLLEELGKNCDYVILDLPPLGPVIDARTVSARLDGIIMVIEWGKTARKVVSDVLNADPHIRSKCLGAIFNKVDQRSLKRYQAFGSSDYYRKRYARYYNEQA